MDYKPLISILIPAYNAESFVAKAIESILNQTYENLEIWLLDDASTDSTRKILNSYEDSRIKRYFVDDNTKKIGIVNEVLRKVNGDFIAFQDADDWSESDRIEKQLDLFKSDNELDIVFTGTDIKENNSIKIDYIDAPETDKEIKSIFYNYGKTKSKKSLACATMLVKKTIINQVGGYNPYFKGKAGSDIFWVYNILKVSKSHCINEPLYHVTRTENSFTEQLHSIKNIKSAYIWKVIASLIEYDQKGIKLLEDKNQSILKTIELEACESAFKDTIEKKNKLIKRIKSSASYRIGNLIVNSLSFLKR